MSGILWIASYPKSGSTWLRAFIANLRQEGGEIADINHLGIPTAANRRLFYETAGIEASDLTDEEVARLRPEIYRYLATTSQQQVILKIHDARTNSEKASLIPSDVTIGAVYILRNPLDVAVSFAHHASESIEWAITTMGCATAAFSSDTPIRNLNQRLLTWSEHVLSWVDRPPFPVHVVRYEDLHQQPTQAFTQVARACALSTDERRIQQAIRNSTFASLRAQEQARDFIERPPATQAFFREGKADGWRKTLSETQVARIVADHEAVMRRFGYYPL
ncbi:MAG: sulfotransferase domain-containing protein [Acidobacteriota bacterium]|nr:sulfotransferase domain-containing protein [Acidobacteriota bacterium]